MLNFVLMISIIFS